MSKKQYNTFDLLKSTGSFYLGMGTVLNISGNYFDYNYSDSQFEADARALENDWGVVGNDINKSLREFENDYNEAKSTQLALNFD